METTGQKPIKIGGISPVLLRSAEETDLPALAALEQACFSTPMNESMLRSLLPDERHVFLLAEVSGSLLGYVNMTYVLDEGYIYNVAVAQPYRRQGIGHMLLSELEQQARVLKLATLTLEVRDSNAPAIALYKKHGYALAGRRRNYYNSPREDARIMTCILSPENMIDPKGENL